MYRKMMLIELAAPCYLCGKEAVVDGLCSSCYNEQHPLMEVPTPISLHACKKCGSPLTGAIPVKEEVKQDYIIIQEGGKIPDKPNFCPTCGSSLKNAENLRFCEHCGAKII